MFVLCMAYVCVSLRCGCATSKIATALPARAFRPGIWRSVAQLQWCNAVVCCGGKSALHRVQTSNDTCAAVESQLRWVQDRAHRLKLRDTDKEKDRQKERDRYIYIYRLVSDVFCQVRRTRQNTKTSKNIQQY